MPALISGFCSMKRLGVFLLLGSRTGEQNRERNRELVSLYRDSRYNDTTISRFNKGNRELISLYRDSRFNDMPREQRTYIVISRLPIQRYAKGTENLYRYIETPDITICQGNRELISLYRDSRYNDMPREQRTYIVISRLPI